MRFAFTVWAAVLLADSATAQFILRPFPGFQNYGVYQRSYGFYAPSPTGGYGFQFRQTYYRVNNGLAFVPVAPLNAAAINQTRLYAAASGSGQPLNDRQQMALQKAQRANRAGVNERVDAVDKLAGQVVPKDLVEQAPPAAQAALAAPNDADLLSGLALNRVLKAIHELEEKGVRANAPFLPPELLQQTVFQNGPAADVLNLFAEEKLPFPAALRHPETDATRLAMEKDFEAILQQQRTNKKGVEPQLLDRLAAQAKKLQSQLPASAKNDAAIEFLTKLEATVKWYQANPAVLVPAWHTVGSGVGDVTRHMAKYKLEFGPALAADDGAYASLFRGLTTYLSDLLAAKR